MADLGTYDELVASGVTHVAVAEPEWGALFAKHEVNEALESEVFVKRRQFYEELFEKGTLLRQFNRASNYYLSPQLRIYEVR